MKKALTSVIAAVSVFTVLAPSSFAATTASAPSVQGAITGASKWMLTNQLSKMQDWTLVSTYAGSGAFHSGTWSKDTISNLSVSTDVSRTILGVLAAGLDPHSVGGRNLVLALVKTQLQSGGDIGKFPDSMDGTGTDLINNQSWAIIALEDAGGISYNRTTAGSWLLAHQNKDGGFGYSAQYNTSDADDTAAAIDALSLLGYSAQSDAVANALSFLKTQQATDGGFGGATSNSDSTGTVIDALEMLGIQPTTWTESGGNPETALLSFYDSTTGGFKYDNTDGQFSGVSGLSTRDALFGLSALSTGRSVYQRLHWHHFTTLNDYWTNVYHEGGAFVYHQRKSWAELRPMAIAGTYLASLTPSWQAVVKAHGKYVQHGKVRTWESWDSTLATQALVDSFGWNTVHLNLL